MPSYTCLSKTCKFLKEGANANLAAEKKVPYRETTALTKKNLQCKHCRVKMVEDDTPNQQQPATTEVAKFNIDDAFAAVETAKKLPERVLYVKGVTASLLKANSYFQDEFVTDMNNPAHVTEFVSGKRLADKGVVCVDSALKVCGIAAPTGTPAGAKFDWEIIYLMDHAKWKIAGAVMQQKFPALVKSIADGEQYIVSTMPDHKGASIGHTFVLTKLGSDLWLSDAQKLTNDYRQHKYVAWKRPGPPAKVDKLEPRRKVDATTGEFAGDWS